jgi:hypothetical protein
MTLSRHMPAIPEHKTKPIAYVLLVLFVSGLFGLCWAKPFAGLIIALLAITGWVFSLVEKRRLRKMADARNEESICSFARSFDRHSVDMWIVRAVYEGLQKYMESDHDRFPIRAKDRIDKDLDIDGEDLDDLAYDVGARAGYDMTQTKDNPLFGRVETVEDMVMFFMHQPKLQGDEK